MFNNDDYVVKPVEKLFDKETGTVVEKKDVDPWELIKTVAKSSNVTLREPRKGCHKCYGRGWVGKDSKTQQPIPCNCVFEPKELKEQPIQIWNHSTKRAMMLETRRRMKKKSKTILKQATSDLMKDGFIVEENVTSATEVSAKD